MKLRDFIVSDSIVPELSASDRDSAISELVKSLATAGALPESAVDEVVAALIKRDSVWPCSRRDLDRALWH